MLNGNIQFIKKMSTKVRILGICYLLFTAFLFLYSYTQVDLSLTLSRANLWQTIQKWFQYIGYFNRPLSTALFCAILAGLFVLYAVTLRWIRDNKIRLKDLWFIILPMSIILWFSYPAFSYDLFNHMFTAKTVLVYHQNPYTVTPLQFTGIEPWLSFMHWTQVASIYSPLWIFITLPTYFFGFGFFLLEMWNLKAVLVISYIVTAWAIGNILEHEGEQNKMLGIAIFALNPLVIIESLVSAHNDILMMAFTMLALMFYLKGKRWISWLFLSLSIATKVMTVCLIPSFFLRWKRSVALIGMIVGLALFLTQREVMSWYLLWIIPFCAILPEKRWLTMVIGGVSLGLLLRYAPFLYLGNWDNPVPTIKLWVTFIPIVLAVLLSLALKLYQKDLHR